MKKIVAFILFLMVLAIASVVALVITFFDDRSSFSTKTKEFVDRPVLELQDFNLLGSDGKVYNKNSLFLDSPSKKIFFFGFTFCPDICPGTLLLFSQLIQESPDLANLPIYFVSVDPDRDTVEVLRAYLPNFTSHVIGLTGLDSQISKIAKIFYIYRKKIPQDLGEYTYDHTTTVFLIDSKNRIFETILFNEPYRAFRRKNSPISKRLIFEVSGYLFVIMMPSFLCTAFELIYSL